MTQTAREIAEMLAARVEDVCSLLLPGGKAVNGEWEAGSVLGDKGKSLKVRLTGGKTGVWSDFASGEAGDLLDLWVLAKNVKFIEALREAKAWLGISEPRYEPQRKVYQKPKSSFLIPASVGDPVQEYLVSERKLAPETISAYGVASSKGGTFVAFPYQSPEGELLNVKQIGIKRDEKGKKIVFAEKDCAPALFGWQAFKGGRSITITEGEIDAMTMTQYGMQALSVPFGAGKEKKNDWIDFEWDNLAQFDTIYLCYDNDEAGQSCVAEVARRLGIHRCRSILLPLKDANECLQKGIDVEDILECVRTAKSFDPPEIRAPTEYQEKVLRYFYPNEEAEAKVYTPGILGKKISFRPGEITVWTGMNSHGKSLLLGQLMIGAAVSGKNSAIASMEMKPEQTLGRMLRQFWAERRPTEEQIARALEWLSGKVWIYDLMGNVATDKILSLQEFSTRRHNVTHFVIDSLMKCNVDGDDYNAQRKFLNEAATFAKRNDCHTHIIAHPRKGDEEKPVNRFCISGSGDISNQADNIVSVWRNKAKERNEKTWSKYDAVILCDKQRETGWEGYITLDFAKNIEQYLVPGQEATKYFEWAFKPEPQDEQEQINFDEPPPPEPPPTYDTPLPSSWASDVPTEGTMI